MTGLCLLAILLPLTSCQLITPKPTFCDDGTLNGQETDVDCGGPACVPCASGQLCLADGDCGTGLCALNRCADRTCIDGVKNGAETGLDCGGPCAPCPANEGCMAPTDCASGACVDGGCVAPSCTDGAKDGTETDVDCGGACGPCEDAKACREDADCRSGGCTDALCGQPCTPPLKACSSACVNVQADPSNCGVCGKTCLATELCSAGSCVPACLGGTIDCGSGCVDPKSNPLHCGSCPNACSPGQFCVAGSCQSSCGVGAVACGPDCAVLSRDAQHCGSCPNACPPGSACVAGTCTIGCPAPLSVCAAGTLCADTQNDPGHCGMCGNACPFPSGALPSCVNGQCGLGPCSTFFADCNGDPADGCEADLSFSGNCGVCGKTCAGSEVCGINGCCLPSLPAGTYQGSCQGCTACDGTLTCLCKDAAQNLQPASISLTPACPGGYTNCNGVLLCNAC